MASVEIEEQSKRRNVRLTGLILWVLLLLGLVYWWTQSRGASVREQDIEAATLPAWLDGTHPCVSAVYSGGKMTTSLGRCATPTQHTGPVDRFEADLRYGAFELRQSDLELGGPGNTPFTRTYSSHDDKTLIPAQAFGTDATHQFDIAPLGSRWPYTYIDLVLEDGDYLHFQRISKGEGFADAVYMHVETSTRFYKSILRWNGDGWTLRLADGEEMRFPEAYLSKTMAQCAPYEVRDSSGNVLKLQRDDDRKLQEIDGPRGHWIRLEYDTGGRIVYAHDDAGKWDRYVYEDNLLTGVTHSSGAQRRYEYQGASMTAVYDEHGRQLVRNLYDNGTLVSQTFLNGDTYSYEYDWAPGSQYAQSVTVTLPDQTQRVIPTADSVPATTREQ